MSGHGHGELDRRTLALLIGLGAAAAATYGLLFALFLAALFVDIGCPEAMSTSCDVDHALERRTSAAPIELGVFPTWRRPGSERLRVVRDPQGAGGSWLLRRCFPEHRYRDQELFVLREFASDERVVYAVCGRFTEFLDSRLPWRALELVFSVEAGRVTEVSAALYDYYLDETVSAFAGSVELDRLAPEPGERIRCAFTLHDGSPERVWCVNGEVELPW